MIKLFRFLKPYRAMLGLVVLLVFLQSLADLYLPTLLAQIVDTGIKQADTQYMLRIGTFMLGIAAIGALCAIGASYCSSRIAVGFGKRVRSNIFAHVEKFSLHEFDKIGAASLITRTTNDTTQIQQVLMMILSMMVGAPIICIGGIIMAIREDIALSWVIVAIIPVLIAAIFSIVGRATPFSKVMQKKLDTLNLFLEENLTGIRVIRSFNRGAYEQKRFDGASQDLVQTTIKMNRIVGVMMPLMMFLLNMSTIAIIWFGGLRIDAGAMQIGSLMAFLQYVMQILFSLMMVSFLSMSLPRAAIYAKRINEVLDLNLEINDAAQIQTIEKRRGHVEFQHVSFSYPGAEKSALTDISFQARVGEITAIIGGTGSGKSTLVSLISRFYDVESGSVLVDGVDVRAMSQESLRAKIGLVSQKTYLFSGTIAENIRHGKRDASESEVVHAAQIAQATEFIAEKKDGFSSTIVQGGTNISGGQKQRLSIARALVRRPEIYIFDDSFSALDFKTDARLRKALKKETTTSTVFVVAQRVSTVMDADQIIVLDEGKIVGIGRHRELIENSKIYREIVFSQLSAEEIA